MMMKKVLLQLMNTITSISGGEITTTATSSSSSVSPVINDKNILDVAIIGSGPGGLSAALALKHITKLQNICVFEKASSFRPIGAALGLNTMGYDALQELGAGSISDGGLDLMEKVRGVGCSPLNHVLQRPNGEVMWDDEPLFYKGDSQWLSWYGLQSALKDSLYMNSKNDNLIRLNKKLVSISEDKKEGIVTLSFDDGEIVHTRILIGADGYRSIVRRNTVNDGEPTYTGTMTWRGVMDRRYFNKVVKMDPFKSKKDGVVLSVIGEGKHFWIMDCGNGKIAWTGTAIDDSSDGTPCAKKQKALEVFQGWTPIVGAIISATEDAAIVESGVYDRDPVHSWGVSKGGKFKRTSLLGDAAHPMRPSMGLGSTMAFQDAVCLAKNLCGVDLPDTKRVAECLAKYEKERIAVTAPLQKEARRRGEEGHEEGSAEQMKDLLISFKEMRNKNNAESAKHTA